MGYNEVYTSNERANQMGFNQPYVVIGQQFYGNTATFLNTSSLVFPSTTGSVDYHEKLPRIYNWSIGVQRALPGNLALDVSYVGNTDRWLQSATDLNAFPAGWRFQPFDQDPTTGKPLPDNLIRKYPEYAAMTYLQQRHAMGEIVTGLLYVDPEPEDLHKHMNIVTTPLNELDEVTLCPGSAALEKLNASLR